jgi:hypothetical protein
MTDDITHSESLLGKLGVRLRQAWAKQHPLTPKELEAVRQAIRKQWEAEHRVEPKEFRATQAESPRPSQPLAHETEQEQQTRERKQKQIRDQDHGHSH